MSPRGNYRRIALILGAMSYTDVEEQSMDLSFVMEAGNVVKDPTMCNGGEINGTTNQRDFMRRFDTARGI